MTNDCQSKFLFIIIFDFINSFIILNLQVFTNPPFVHQSNLYCDISFIFSNYSINLNFNFTLILGFLPDFNLQLTLLISFLRIIFLSGDVIAALTSGQPHIPYRNHPLTMLMSDRCVLVLCCIINCHVTDGQIVR